MSFWNSTIGQEWLWKACWFPILFVSLYFYKHELSKTIISYLVAGICLIYCLFLSYFEIATGMEGLILAASLTCSFNNLNGKHLLLLFVVHLLTIFYMVQYYWAFKQDPFGSSYGLPYDSLVFRLSHIEFVLFYLSLTTLAILMASFTIYSLKKSIKYGISHILKFQYRFLPSLGIKYLTLAY